MKSMKTKTTKRSKIPEFKSYEEEAEFWDTLDSTQLTWEELVNELATGKTTTILGVLSYSEFTRRRQYVTAHG